ncbi:unnamed protein product [Phytophthora fragariaefolia]|uniref:Unnamed protein product n=1 Tax=Phytophthora fragariaefolia TaxID=1490495 RepID=A0A9W6XKN0_9STRA|nr:unnamed protein product [Phytophthora fragariaefolia]
MRLCIALFRNDRPGTWARKLLQETARGFRYQHKIGLAELSVPIPNFALFDHSGGMSHYVFESDAEDDLEGDLLFELISEHTTKEEAVIALHSADTAEYHFLNNYTNTGASCVKSTLQGGHGTEASNRKRPEIDMTIRQEVDSLLKGEAGPKRCRLMLLQKYSTNPGTLLKIPDVVKLKNRKATLKQSRFTKWDIKGISVMMEWAHTKILYVTDSIFWS